MQRIQTTLSSPIPKLIIAFFGALLMPIAAAMTGLFLLVIIDFCVGVARAVKESKFSSVRMRTGAHKIILYSVVILSVRLMEAQLLHTYGKNIIFMSEFVILFFSITELASILETVSILGVSVPSPVLEFFHKQADFKKLKE